VDGASEIARESQAEMGRAGVIDQIINPAMELAARDLERKEISAVDQALFATWSRDIVEQLLPVGDGAPAP
jgi:hypothetical protein